MFKNALKITALFLILFVFACKKETAEPAINEAEVLVQYLESAESPLKKDYVATDLPAIIGATEVKTLNLTNQVYIIDIRSAADFATGHIANAHNVLVADVLTHIKGVNLTPYTKVAIVCYTGQTAGYVASLLRLIGYDKVYSMKWGMSSWNTAFAGKWNTAIASGNSYATQFVSTATPKAAKTALPKLATGETVSLKILENRVNALLTEGFTPASVTSGTVFTNLTGYYIVNYWTEAQYTTPGHIPGAIQYTPKESLKFAVDLTTLPADKPVAVYCFTGQTSAHLVAYLRLLGYDAKSILYGANGMIYDLCVTNKMTVFKATEIMEYEYVQ